MKQKIALKTAISRTPMAKQNSGKTCKPDTRIQMMIPQYQRALLKITRMKNPDHEQFFDGDYESRL